LGFIFVSVFPWFIFGLHYYFFLASLLRNLGCIAARQIRFSGKSPTRLGEVLHMFNGGAANVLWLCIFTTFFMLQCLQRVSGEVRGGAANVQQRCCKYYVALLLLLHFLCFNVSCKVSGKIGGFAANVQRRCYNQAPPNAEARWTPCAAEAQPAPPLRVVAWPAVTK
jgi:hypothetical protein